MDDNMGNDDRKGRDNYEKRYFSEEYYIRENNSDEDIYIKDRGSISNNSRSIEETDFVREQARSDRRRARRRRRRILINVIRTIIICSILTALGGIATVVFSQKDYWNKPVEDEAIEDVAVEDSVGDNIELSIVPMIDIAKVKKAYLDASNKEQDLEEEEAEEILEYFDPRIEAIETTPTSISIRWIDEELCGYDILYRQVEPDSEKHGKSTREDGSASMSSICTAINESNDSGEEKESNGWIRVSAKDSNVTLEGLEPNHKYNIHIMYKEDMGQCMDVFEWSTEKSGYCDPFKKAYSLMRISERDEATGFVLSHGMTSSVQMTSNNGCEGVVVKPILDAAVFNTPTRDNRNQLGTITKGTKLVVTPDGDNGYCYYDDNGYKLHVRSEDGQSTGWIDARSVLIDMNKLFSVDNEYSMLFDRTNAYSSIFTAGGDAQNVETAPAPTVINPETGEEVPNPLVDGTEDYFNTRYNPLIVNGDLPTYMSINGYNKIDGVTDQALLNYESKDYMPVIWDLAMELKQCQKNALENGYTIKMYEGYRPLSTSQLVYNSLNGSGVLSVVVGDTTLAQGYITSQEYNVGHYIGYRSRHNRGVATDLTIVRLSSDPEKVEEAHMQTKMHTLDFRCNMTYNTWEADLLTDIMIGHDSHLEYLGNRQEWWHFQLRNNRTDLYPMISYYGYESFTF